ncbi:unnamed protein product [Brassica oleracea var. botrytis]
MTRRSLMSLFKERSLQEACWLLYRHSTFTTFLLATAFLLVVFSCLSSFQIYSMPIFDSFAAS